MDDEISYTNLLMSSNQLFIISIHLKLHVIRFCSHEEMRDYNNALDTPLRKAVP